MVESIFAPAQTIMDCINVQVSQLYCSCVRISTLPLGLPNFREGLNKCHLTPQEYGQFKGCVNWNMFYTNCRSDLCQLFLYDLDETAIFIFSTGPHNPYHGAVSFDNIGLAWVAIFLVQ